MSVDKNVADFGPLLREYSNLWDRYQTLGFNRTLDENDKENTLDSEWALRHYFSVGADALRIMVKNLIAASAPQVAGASSP